MWFKKKYEQPTMELSVLLRKCDDGTLHSRRFILPTSTNIHSFGLDIEAEIKSSNGKYEHIGNIYHRFDDLIKDTSSVVPVLVNK